MTDESKAGRPRPRSGRRTDDRNNTGASARAGWLVPAGLIALSAVPVVAGAARLTELAGGAEVTAENARFFAMPLPVVVHILSATLYSVLGAFQFASGLRRRRPGWHRAAGRILVPCGLAVALSGLWMTLFYPRPPGDGELVSGFRLVFGSAMVLSIVLGLAAIRRRDIARHGAWMTRGYAIGLGAGTQVFTHLPWILFLGKPEELTRALLMAAGWVINLAVAEWVIRKRPPRPRRASSGAALGSGVSS
ncbi:DUF2306 domain-containing protein [Planotetraspora sp. GP83]|uniref:DUF2306 domain-containing protein n=1 Tax=Planotetraspora sp. GP83 TaxID=3156264 RepID=UPI0035180ECA